MIIGFPGFIKRVFQNVKQECRLLPAGILLCGRHQRRLHFSLLLYPSTENSVYGRLSLCGSVFR